MPKTSNDNTISLVLSDYLSTKEQLTQYSHQLRTTKKLSVPRKALVQAFDALKNPQFWAMLEGQPLAPPSSTTAAPTTPASIRPSSTSSVFQQSPASGNLQPGPDEHIIHGRGFNVNVFKKIQPKLVELMNRKIKRFPVLLQDKTLLPKVDAQFMRIYDSMRKTHSLEQIVVESFRRAFPPNGIPPLGQATVSAPASSPAPHPIQSKPAPRFAATELNKSPFAVLGVTTRDDRRRIVELAEEKSLELDDELCQKARSDLTNPRTRLTAEITWLPGVSPHRARQLVEELLRNPLAIRQASGLPTLAHLNLMASAFETVKDSHEPGDLAKFIREMANLAEKLRPEAVRRDINADRAISGFSEVKTIEQIEEELSERKRHYWKTIKEALDRLPSAKLVQVMTDTVNGATSGGKNHAPWLIDEIVGSYEVEAESPLKSGVENIKKLIQFAKDSAPSGESSVALFVDKIEASVRSWHRVAQPIQLNAKARGTEHDLSSNLGWSIRGLVIDLFNNHDILYQAQRLTALLQELFLDIPEIMERVEQDADVFANIFRKRKQAAAQRDEWAREISYCAEVGKMFKNTLSISPKGVSWKGQNFSLESITRVRWGGVRHSINGIPTGTNYTIAFGDDHSEAVVELGEEGVYSVFVDKLWRAVCVRLLVEMLNALKSGGDLQFGDAVIHDDGVTLVKHKVFGANERVRYIWSQVRVWSASGLFYIGAQNDGKTYSCASYIYAANTHILEQAVRMAFKEQGACRLSDLLE